MIACNYFICEKCGSSSDNQFEIEHHESIPDPPPLPLRVGDKIWIESQITLEMDRLGETKSPVLRTITKISISRNEFGTQHGWQIDLDLPIAKEDDVDGYLYDSYSITNGMVRTDIFSNCVDLDMFYIDASTSTQTLEEMKISFYEGFSG